MSVVIVTSAQLGSRCWSAYRLAGTCAACKRYDACIYPERVPDLPYDELRADGAALKKQSEAAYAAAKKISRR